MIIADLKAEIESKPHGDFISRCIFDRFSAAYATVLSLADQAPSTDDFLRSILDTPATCHTQGAAVVLQYIYPNLRWKAIRSAFGTDCRKSWTDIGGIVVKSADMRIVIRNGRGDGEQRYVILDHEPDWSILFCHEGYSSFDVLRDGGAAIDGEPLSRGLWFAYAYDGLVLIYRARDLFDEEA